MNAEKIIRSLCFFSRHLNDAIPNKLEELENRLLDQGYQIQTRRACFYEESIKSINTWSCGDSFYLSAGTLDFRSASSQLDPFLKAKNTAFNLDLTSGMEPEAVSLFFEIIRRAPQRSFSFAFTFNNKSSSPFFPSAAFSKQGFAIGLQSTDLSEECETVDEWLQNMKTVWKEIHLLFADKPEFLGIDSSIAPLYSGKSSFVNFLKRQKGSFSNSVATDIFLKISNFIITQNPKPVGLCGIMLPCLEDFELAVEYEAGNFPLERNIFLSLHCGLGIDTYPIGIDESPDRVLEILSLLQQLSVKYNKALSARFVSDGQSSIGQKSNFNNQFLKDVVIRPL
ncbi:MAG: DUF711 family protein [SAR324 cluster bacterium]|nr:DUF711 family protein [SAR324 cluster bacterium]